MMRPLPSSRGSGCSYGDGVVGGHSGTVNPTEALPLWDIAITIFRSSPRASGGSGEAGRGIGEADLKVWGQEKGRFHPHAEGAVLTGMGLYDASSWSAGPFSERSTGLYSFQPHADRLVVLFVVPKRVRCHHLP